MEDLSVSNQTMRSKFKIPNKLKYDLIEICDLGV